MTGCQSRWFKQVFMMFTARSFNPVFLLIGLFLFPVFFSTKVLSYFYSDNIPAKVTTSRVNFLTLTDQMKMYETYDQDHTFRKNEVSVRWISKNPIVLNACFRHASGLSAIPPSRPSVSVAGSTVNDHLKPSLSSVTPDNHKHHYYFSVRLNLKKTGHITLLGIDPGRWVLDSGCSSILTDDGRRISSKALVSLSSAAPPDDKQDESGMSAPFQATPVDQSQSGEGGYSSGGGQDDSDDDFKKKPGGSFRPFAFFEYTSKLGVNFLPMATTHGNTLRLRHKYAFQVNVVLTVFRDGNVHEVIIPPDLWVKIRSFGRYLDPQLVSRLAHNPFDPEQAYRDYLRESSEQPFPYSENYVRWLLEKQPDLIPVKVSIFPGNAPAPVGHPNGGATKGSNNGDFTASGKQSQPGGVSMYEALPSTGPSGGGGDDGDEGGDEDENKNKNDEVSRVQSECPRCKKKLPDGTFLRKTTIFTKFTDLCPDCQESIRVAPGGAAEQNIPSSPRRDDDGINLSATSPGPLFEILSRLSRDQVLEITRSHFGPEDDSLRQRTISVFSDPEFIDEVLEDNRIPRELADSICVTPLDYAALVHLLTGEDQLHPQYSRDLKRDGFITKGFNISTVEVLSDGSVASADVGGNLIIRTPEGDIKWTEEIPGKEDYEDTYYEEKYITKIIDFPPGILLLVDNKGGISLSIGSKISELPVSEEGVSDGKVVSNHACAIDENRFAMASGNDILIWTVNRLELSRTCKSILTGHEDSVSALIKLPRGQLASGGSDGNIMIWDVDQTRPVHTLTGHGHRVTSLAAVSDSLLVSGDTEGNLILWDVDQGSSHDIRKAHEHGVEHLLRLPDGRLMSATSDRSGSEVKTWSVNHELKQFTQATVSFSSCINYIGVFAPGELVVNYQDQAIEVWKLYQPEKEHSEGASTRRNKRDHKLLVELNEGLKKALDSPEFVGFIEAGLKNLKRKPEN